MLHAARQLPAWLICDVGQTFGSISTRTIGSEVAEEAARRPDRAGTVSSACDTGRTAGQSCRRPRAVVLAAFGQSRSWPIRATHATQADIFPRRDSPPHFQVATFPGSEVHPSCRPMKSRVCSPLIAIRSRAAGFLFPNRPTRRQSQRRDLSRCVRPHE
jgi:hypothetical protein